MVLNDTDHALIAATCDGLPLVARPYAALAQQLGMGERELIERFGELQAAGLVKRMGVVVRHRALGYSANAMVVWDVPDPDVERIGRLLSAEPCVTLCYQRPRRLPRWPYNLFCMIHGRERYAVQRCLDQIIESHALQSVAHEVLFSTRAFKQCGARYGNMRKLREYAGAVHG